MKKILFFFLFTVYFITGVKAQDSIPVKKIMTRADYVEDHTHEINITPFLYNSRNGFVLSGNRRSINYDPNESYSIGLRLMHKWLGFAISYGPKNLQEKSRGTTTYTSVVVNSFGKKIGFDAYYLFYKGYYISNPGGIDELKNSFQKDFPKIPGLETFNLGLNMYYLFNHEKYSYRSGFMQNEIQKKTAGSFFLVGSFSYYSLKSDTSIVPQSMFNIIDKESRIEDGNFYSFSLLPGYAFTFVLFKKGFITFSPSAGIMAQQKVYTINNSSETVENFEWIPRVMLRAGIGYNGQKFYTGFSALIDNYNVPLGRGDKLTYLIGNGTFYIGMRLGVPKSLKKYSDKMDALNPLLLFSKKKN